MRQAKRSAKMADAWSQIAATATTPAQAVLQACQLEATAPKAGNVHPGESFADLQYSDFMTAGKIAADAYAEDSQAVCQRTLSAATQIARDLNTNVNLGILLLLTPLIAADELNTIERKVGESNQPPPIAFWQPAVARALATFDADDSVALMRSISVSVAGGMGKVDRMDVNDLAAVESVDIVAAMKLASSRDRIARQYADAYIDFFDNVVPVVSSSLQRVSDPLQGIADAHLELLAADVDTLIARKWGTKIAADVQRRAQQVDLDDPASRDAFDRFLRSQSNRLNPGTTADLIAAALYVLLRSSLPFSPNE